MLSGSLCRLPESFLHCCFGFVLSYPGYFLILFLIKFFYFLAICRITA